MGRGTKAKAGRAAGQETGQHQPTLAGAHAARQCGIDRARERSPRHCVGRSHTAERGRERLSSEQWAVGTGQWAVGSGIGASLLSASAARHCAVCAGEALVSALPAPLLSLLSRPERREDGGRCCMASCAFLVDRAAAAAAQPRRGASLHCPFPQPPRSRSPPLACTASGAAQRNRQRQRPAHTRPHPPSARTSACAAHTHRHTAPPHTALSNPLPAA